MTKNILAFGASNSKHSINKQLASYTAHQLEGASINLIDLNDYEMPIYSIDRERESGIPQLALDFKELIRQSDGIIASFAEHNGAYTAAFKNIYDWVSRIEKDVWMQKPMFIMAAAPGGRGGIGVLELAQSRFRRQVPQMFTFSLPFFSKNFNTEDGILDETLKAEWQKQLEAIQLALGN